MTATQEGEKSLYHHTCHKIILCVCYKVFNPNQASFHILSLNDCPTSENLLAQVKSPADFGSVNAIVQHMVPFSVTRLVQTDQLFSFADIRQVTPLQA